MGADYLFDTMQPVLSLLAKPVQRTPTYPFSYTRKMYGDKNVKHNIYYYFPIQFINKRNTKRCLDIFVCLSASQIYPYNSEHKFFYQI